MLIVIAGHGGSGVVGGISLYPLQRALSPVKTNPFLFDSQPRVVCMGMKEFERGLFLVAERDGFEAFGSSLFYAVRGMRAGGCEVHEY